MSSDILFCHILFVLEFIYDFISWYFDFMYNFNTLAMYSNVTFMIYKFWYEFMILKNGKIIIKPCSCCPRLESPWAGLSP